MAYKDNSHNSQLPFVSHLECLSCGNRYSKADLLKQFGTLYTMGDFGVVYGNPCCLGPLDIRYHMDNVRRILTQQEVKRRYDGSPAFTMLRELLPVDDIHIDGDTPFTPLVRAPKIEAKIKAQYGKEIQVYLKIEETPTGSFKFRPTSLAFNKALEDGGYLVSCTSSTFNLGRTTNWLAEKHTLGSLLFIPASVGRHKIGVIDEHSTVELEEITTEDFKEKGDELIERYAAKLVEDIRDRKLSRQVVSFAGNYDKANRFSLQVADAANTKTEKEEGRMRVFIPNSIFRPYYKEGSKTYGFEVALQLMFQYGIPPYQPVKIIYPIGSGALACSATKGIRELNELGIFQNPVRLYAAQAELVMPVVDAFRRYQQTGQKDILPFRTDESGNRIHWNPAETLAQSIAIADPGSGPQTIDLIIETQGGAISVAEEQIVDGLIDLKELEGILAQDVGGVALSALYNGIQNGDFNTGDVVVVGVTGIGLELMRDKLIEFAGRTGLEKEVARLL